MSGEYASTPLCFLCRSNVARARSGARFDPLQHLISPNFALHRVFVPFTWCMWKIGSSSAEGDPAAAARHEVAVSTPACAPPVPFWDRFRADLGYFCIQLRGSDLFVTYPDSSSAVYTPASPFAPLFAVSCFCCWRLCAVFVSHWLAGGLCCSDTQRCPLCSRVYACVCLSAAVCIVAAI